MSDSGSERAGVDGVSARLAPRRSGDPGPGAPPWRAGIGRGGRNQTAQTRPQEVCPTQADGEAAVLLLRSGSSARRLADAISLRIALLTVVLAAASTLLLSRASCRPTHIKARGS